MFRQKGTNVGTHPFPVPRTSMKRFASATLRRCVLDSRPNREESNCRNSSLHLSDTTADLFPLSCYGSRVGNMLTFFATAKPFRNQSALLQRNALQSWKSLRADVEIILFGEDEGARETCHEFCLRHEPCVELNEFGSKRLDFMFARAQQVAPHDLLCYINCDILLLPDFCSALERVFALLSQFLMVVRRWDTDFVE